MPENVKHHIKFIMKKEKVIKGLIFGDYYNNINHNSVLTGVTVPVNQNKNQNKIEDGNNDLVPNHFNHPNEFEINDTTVNNDADIGNTKVDTEDHDTNDSSSTGVHGDDGDSSSTGVDDNSDSTGVTPEDHDDEFVPPSDDDSNNGNRNDVAPTARTTRSGRVSRQYNFANNFPALYGNTNHVAGKCDTLCLHPYYYNDKLNLQLGAGISYSSSLFTDNVEHTGIH